KPLLLKSLLPESINLATASIDYSPNYRQAILSLMNDDAEIAYLISLDNENTELFDITSSKENVLAAWNSEKNEEMMKVIETLPKELITIATDTFQIIAVAPNEKRIMYRVKTDTNLPLVLNPPLIGANQTPEERNLKAGGIYIYDKKEDKNYKVPVEISITEEANKIVQTELVVTDSSATDSAMAQLPQVWYPEVVYEILEYIQWYPTSDYIVVKERNHISVMQYDGDNKETVYAGPFENDFFMIAPDWNLLVVINLNPQVNSVGDLYSVGIK
ncbi:MAG TPA: hypothetical protein PLS49_03585, partial [Candidatus Woesebacteria bacterium]|nr:hypothetical protein [Candidatus Woesebacteria bacterium]